jgi:hypothetical protein
MTHNDIFLEIKRALNPLADDRVSIFEFPNSAIGEEKTNEFFPPTSTYV